MNHPEPNDEFLTRRSPFIVLLPLIAVVMLSLTAWRMANPRQPRDPDQAPDLTSPAPAFQLYDQGGDGIKPRVVNLESYLHRHRIVLAFYDGQKGPEADPLLRELRTFHRLLQDEGIIVFGISTALPQENRRNSTSPFPFKLLSDVTATAKNSVHRTWGRFKEPPSIDQPAGTKPGVFLIDRKGLVTWDGDHPKPDSDPDTFVARLLQQ